MNQRLRLAEAERQKVSRSTSQAHKASLGQFMTPSIVAGFMAELFEDRQMETCRLLDAGAGLGALSCAVLDRWKAGELKFAQAQVTAYEIDASLRVSLESHLAGYSDTDVRIIAEDYIHHASGATAPRGFTHAILNPPYKKINSLSDHRLALRKVGIETVNLYSAFVALAVDSLEPGGQIVAIIPRSFCNGPYYRPFRDFVLARSALRHMHLFNARNKAFRDDDVLQENIIIHLERGAEQGEVRISTSTDDTFSDLEVNTHPFSRIVFPGDSERFIHVPTTAELGALESAAGVCHALEDIGIKVSTGPVVDFRLKDHLRALPGADTVPLLYPGHFGPRGVTWPIAGMKKANAIARNDATERWLYPTGHYCIVRRFSSKEERRRIVASVVEPSDFPDAEMIGFENHLNVFHEGRSGLPRDLAFGLAAFLNMTAVDEGFRRFNGHTQVNATDLKLMKYPSRAALIELGEWAQTQATMTQQALDERLECLA